MDDSWVNWVKFFGVISGIILFAFILKWLGLSDWFDIIAEVFLRGVMLMLILVIAFVLLGHVEIEWRDESRSGYRYRNVVGFVAFFGAAAVMTFWDSFIASEW